MTYFSLPLSFMHPNSIVMHPPKSLALSGLSLFGWDAEPVEEEPAGPPVQQGSPYVITAASGGRVLLEKVALFTRPVETVIYMHSGFDVPGRIRYTLTDAADNLILERETWLTPGAGSHGIEMSSLKPGQYKLLVSWLEDDEESVVMYEIEKLL